MTIQQKADEYVGHPEESDEELTTYMQREAFKKGADYMLIKVCENYCKYSQCSCCCGSNDCEQYQEFIKSLLT